MEIHVILQIAIRTNSLILLLCKKYFLKTVFEIGRGNTGCDNLILEIGEDYSCYALLKAPERKFDLIKYVTYDELDGDKLSAIFDELKNENCSQILICPAFSQAMLIPNRYSNAQHPLLSSIYDLPFHKQFSDPVPEWQIVAAYSIPEHLFSLINDRFSSARFIHAYTPALKMYNGFVAANQIDVYFNTQHFRVLVKKDKHVQLAQTYAYKTPLDVVYYLLKICYEFGFDQSQAFLILSGLIDQDSAMYTELHNYFLNLHFSQAPVYALPDNDYPQHYFTSLYNLASCVS